MGSREDIWNWELSCLFKTEGILYLIISSYKHSCTEDSLENLNSSGCLKRTEVLMTVIEKFVDLKGKKIKRLRNLHSENQNIKMYKAFIFIQKWAVIHLKRLSKTKGSRLTSLLFWHPITQWRKKTLKIRQLKNQPLKETDYGLLEKAIASVWEKLHC